VDFRQEIGRARSVKSKGWLRLLAQEVRGRRFERPGLQLIARSQWDFKDYSGARQSLEGITRVSPDNVEANLALVTCTSGSLASRSHPTRAAHAVRSGDLDSRPAASTSR